MSLEYVKIAKIGKKISTQNATRQIKVYQNEFFFENCNFRLEIDIDILKVIKGTFGISIFSVCVIL